MNLIAHGGQSLCQTPSPEGISTHAAHGSAMHPSQPSAGHKLWTPIEYRAYLAVGERTFLEMEAKGLLAEARMFGPRLKRYIPDECVAKAMAMPKEKAPEPAQLARARIERLKTTGNAGAAA